MQKLTETDAAADCLYYAIKDEPTFGAEQAKKLAARAQELAKMGAIELTDAMAIVVRFGNHSATRQRLEKYGWFTKNVRADALEVAMRKLQAEDNEVLEEIADGSGEKPKEEGKKKREGE